MVTIDGALRGLAAAASEALGRLESAVRQLWDWPEQSFEWVREVREAQRRAEALLRDSLTEQEYTYLQGEGHLDISSKNHPGRLYQVPIHGGRVRVYEKGKFLGELCVGPVTPLPTADVVLAHKLMIEGCEEEYLRTARLIRTIQPAYSHFGLLYYQVEQTPLGEDEG